jgi:hypothetical protein
MTGVNPTLSVRGQRGRHRHGEFVEAGLTAGGGGERGGEVGLPRHHLQHELADVDPGQHRLDPAP